MPLKSVPAPYRAKYERCVKKLKPTKGDNAYAICFSSVVGKGLGKAAKNKRKGG